ncbi:MAG: hypothetical protein U0169_26300 [Polyangiaceae bacterium]
MLIQTWRHAPNSDQGNQERNCVFAFQACQSRCASDIQLLDCRTCLAGYPAAAQAFAKCAGRLGGICDPKAIEYR